MQITFNLKESGRRFVKAEEMLYMCSAYFNVIHRFDKKR
jgi:hypothetical protein